MLKEEIQQDLKEALKAKRELEVSTLRLLNSAILNKEKEKRYLIAKANQGLKEEELAEKSQLSEEETTDVVSSEIKKRKESVAGFEKGGRKDLVEKESKEIEILKKYQPEQLSEEEIIKLAKEAVEKLKAKEIKDMGKVMSELMPRVKGRADGGLVSKAVKELLS
ncbi:MAG: GatB/YqeY domain-containing protein [Candidatus Nealsonbacteria bacterium]|nr:GatB/YqeY domain-containing protein [Candidatus Nealsonbacteria bacterium]